MGHNSRQFYGMCARFMWVSVAYLCAILRPRYGQDFSALSRVKPTRQGEDGWGEKKHGHPESLEDRE